MKKFFFLSVTFLITLSSFAQQSHDTIISNNTNNLRVRVLYFHITHRCNTCYTIEKLVRQTVDNNFKDYLERGHLDLFIINCELPENKELVQKYDAYGATLAITSFSGGHEQKTIDLTDWAFQNVKDQEKFEKELSIKIFEFLK